MSLRVNIDYEGAGDAGGPGVFVTRDDRQIVNWNSGNRQDDWSAFIDWAFEQQEEVAYGTSITSSGLYQDMIGREG